MKEITDKLASNKIKKKTSALQKTMSTELEDKLQTGGNILKRYI